MGIEPTNKKENRGKSHQVWFNAARIYFRIEISIVITFLGIIIVRIINWFCNNIIILFNQINECNEKHSSIETASAMNDFNAALPMS